MSDRDGAERPLDPEVRALLVCPLCRGELTDDPEGLLCPRDGLLFPVRGGVPWMLPELAIPVTPEVP